ncbi:protein FAR1-RELATED SEQUENCE 5-like isoform X1 [Primulina tabacum]|uniref:protein FAR1-RELATED SEQUENCE 5-like isoform X1 n=1 Tax=Primulina tabacum TaxID=48773 RepID=UPI003F5999BF
MRSSASTERARIMIKRQNLLFRSHFVDIDKGCEAAEIKVGGNGCDVESEGSFEELNENDFFDAKDLEGSEVAEPCVGMEFESEDDAKRFYNDYALRVGFVVRIMQRRRSEIDGRTLARRLGCNKQGFSPNVIGKIGPGRKARPNAREGCKATILFKMAKSGKWVVTRFVKEHNHPLVVTVHEHTMVRDKDKEIQELTQELQHQDQLCAEYRERLLNLLANVEKESDHLSSRVLSVVESVRKSEAEALKMFSTESLKM